MNTVQTKEERTIDIIEIAIGRTERKIVKHNTAIRFLQVCVKTTPSEMYKKSYEKSLAKANKALAELILELEVFQTNYDELLNNN